MKVIIIGGGWAGCAAALTAKKAGAEVHIYGKNRSFTWAWKCWRNNEK